MAPTSGSPGATADLGVIAARSNGRTEIRVGLAHTAEVCAQVLDARAHNDRGLAVTGPGGAGMPSWPDDCRRR